MDGLLMACALLIMKPSANEYSNKLAFWDINSGAQPILMTPDARFAGIVTFHPDGKSLVYVIRENGIENLWAQPLDGSPGHPLTAFKTDLINAYAWFPDGKSIATVRGHWNADVVLLKDTGD